MATPETIFAVLKARVQAFAKGAGNISIAVTRYALTLGAQGATAPYHYAKSYAAGASIDMMIFTKASQQMLVGTGLHVKLDAMGVTSTAVTKGDEVKDANNLNYRVMSVVPHPVGDVISFYETQMVYLADHYEHA